MRHGRFSRLPLGSIEAEGWLKKQLILQKNGLTGNLEEQWSDVGVLNGWKGGDGESWERGPYYLDGLVPLAYTLKDQALIDKAQTWIEWALASQRENGLFGPSKITTVNLDVDKNQDWWHYMIMLKVMMQYHEATGDERVIGFLDRFLSFVNDNIKDMPLRGWAKSRGSEMLLCINWLREYVDKPYLSGLADLLIEQTADWTGILSDFPYWRKVEKWDWTTHVVNVAMGIKMPGLIYEHNGDRFQWDAVSRGIDSLMTYHGQAHGMFSGDEWLSGTSPSQGVELCAIVEYMFTLEELSRLSGDGRYGDILEKVVFNALPASISPDWMSHQYDQQVNQVICHVAPRSWSNGPDANLFGLEPNFGCCTANMHQGWPKFTASLAMKDREQGGFAIVSYAPSRITTKTDKGSVLTMEISGDYPFREEIRIEVGINRAEEFPLSFRIPRWCDDASLLINGKRIDLEISRGYARHSREWKDKDLIVLTLPISVRISKRSMYAAGIERGPLLFAIPVEEDWRLLVRREMFHDYEIHPAGPWQYGLLPGHDKEVEIHAVPDQPFGREEPAPVQLKGKGKFLPHWGMENNSAAPPFLCEDDPLAPEVVLTLIPYGAARLRIGEIP